MKKSKFKSKIFVAVFSILLTYISVLILAPNIWLALLPIIIATSVLTAGIPVYAIIKYSKESLEKATNNKPPIIKQPNIEKEKIKKVTTPEKKVINQNTDLVDDIVNDNNLPPEDKKQMLELFKTECEQNSQVKQQSQKTK